MYGKFATRYKDVEIVVALDDDRVYFFVEKRDGSIKMDFSLSYATRQEAHRIFIDIIMINDPRSMCKKIISIYEAAYKVLINFDI